MNPSEDGFQPRSAQPAVPCGPSKGVKTGGQHNSHAPAEADAMGHPGHGALKRTFKSLTTAELTDYLHLKGILDAAKRTQAIKLLVHAANRVSTWRDTGNPHLRRQVQNKPATQGVKNHIKDIKSLADIISSLAGEQLPLWLHAGVAEVGLPQYPQNVKGMKSSAKAEPKYHPCAEHSSTLHRRQEILVDLVKREFDAWPENIRQDLSSWIQRRAAQTGSGKRKTYATEGPRPRKIQKVEIVSPDHMRTWTDAPTVTAGCQQGGQDVARFMATSTSRTPMLDNLIGQQGILKFETLLALTDFIIELSQVPGWQDPMYDSNGQGPLDYSYVSDESRGFFEVLLKIHAQSVNGDIEARRQDVELVLQPMVAANAQLVRREWKRWHEIYPSCDALISFGALEQSSTAAVHSRNAGPPGRRL